MSRGGALRRDGHDSAAFDKLRLRARRGEPFGPERFDTARNPECIEGLKAKGLVAGRTVLSIRFAQKMHFVVFPENAYFLIKIPFHHYFYGEGHDIFSSIPGLPAWSFQGVTDG
jgi:hypothetical protein